MPKYYSSREGALCTRYGTGTHLGATVAVVGGQTQITWHPERVYEITDAEMVKFTREYMGHVADGSLVERSEADYAAWLAKEKAESEAEAAALKKQADEAAAAEKKAADAAKKKQADEAKATATQTNQAEPAKPAT